MTEPYTFEELAENQTDAVQGILRRARALIRELVPAAEERAHRGWKNVVFGTGPGVVGQPLALAPYRAHVNLYVEAPEGIADPAGLLEGTGKRMRHVKLRSLADVERPEVRAIIAAALVSPRAPAPAASRRATSGEISDAAVREATGHDRAHWFALLDAAGGAGSTHSALVAMLDGHGLSGWWRQMLAVSYEQARGLRAKHQKSDGFAVSGSKTIAAPPAAIWAAWMDAERRDQWLPESAGLRIRTAIEPRQARFDWPAGGRVILYLYPKGEDRVQVTVQHEQLADAESAAREKEAWRQRLDKLRLWAVSDEL